MATGDGADVVVGLDLGTSGLKALALGPDGSVLARARRRYDTARPAPGAAEQSPGAWWEALAGAVREVAADVPPQRWRAVGLSAMLPTLVALDAGGAALGPAITWQDARSERHGDLLRERVGADVLYRRTGQWVDGRYLLPMLAGLRERSPETTARTRFLCGAKDQLFHRLTGELMTDPSTATGFGCYDLASAQWAPEVLDACPEAGVDLAGLPAVHPSGTPRPLRAAVADELGLPRGLPIVLGAADSVLGAYGLGAAAPGDIAYIAGTSTVILGCREAAGTDEQHRFLVTPMAESGYAAEMDLLATGAASAWLAGLLGLRDAGELADLAGEVAPAAAPVFLPYLAPGEQGALWDPDLTGSLEGLTLAHGRAELARALQTGIVLESARCVRVLEQTSGTVQGAVPAIRASGAAGVGPRFAQDLADATGRAVRISPGEPDHSAVGAALLAARALGQDVGPGGPAADLVEARAGSRPLWDELFAVHESARARMTDRRRTEPR